MFFDFSDKYKKKCMLCNQLLNYSLQVFNKIFITMKAKHCDSQANYKTKAKSKSISNSKSRSLSKSKSISKEKTLQKAYTSPPKGKKTLAVKDPHNPLRSKAGSRADISNGQKLKSKDTSGSKSGHKDPHLKNFQSLKRISNSPYHSKGCKSNKKIMKVTQNSFNLKSEIERCKKAIQSHNIEQAIKKLNQLKRKHSDNPDLIYLLGYSNQLMNNTEDAKQYYRSFIKHCNTQKQPKKGYKGNGPNNDRLQQLANASFYLNLFQNVIECCNKILDHSKKWNIYQLKGKAQLARKKYGPAIDSFSNALALNKQKFQILQLQGDCFKGIQAYELALNCYTKYNQNLSFDSLRILQKKAQCFKMLGNKKKEQETEQKIIKLKKQLANQLGATLKTGKQKSKDKIQQGPYQPKQIGGLLPSLRPVTPTLSDVQSQFINGNLLVSFDLVKKIMQAEGPNLQNLYWSAVISLQMQDYIGCENSINHCIKVLQNPVLTLVTLLLPDSQEQNMLNNLKVISNKLKQLNAYSLTEEQDNFIIQRRKKCLQEALNVFKNSSNSDSRIDGSLLNSKLTSILEESSIKSSRIYDNEQNSIFILKHTRKVIKNWCENKFSLQSLEQTTDLAYNLVKIRYKQFAILPMHIIYYTLREQNFHKTFSQIDNEINSVLSKMSEKYPPSESQISNSQLKTFDVTWQKKPKINLFNCLFKDNIPKFNSFKQLHKAIEMLSEKANQQFFKMNQICKQTCITKNNGFGYKIGLKVDKNYTGIVEQRVLSRIIEKMFSKQIKQKRDNFFNDIYVKPNKKLSEYFSDVQKQWQQTVNQIIKQKSLNNQKIECNVYDFLRAKCMFNSISQIRRVALDFVELHSTGDIYLLQIDDRLSFRTRDVVIKFKVKDIVGELQLALQFQSIQNQFNHGLYQLFRSPFGSFFASVMWFSGFALKKNQMFFRQKIKWGLPGLEHLLKFIYQDELYISLINEQEQTSVEAIIVDFEISTNSISCHLCNKSNLYYRYNFDNGKIVQSIQKPKQKFIITLIKNNFIIESPQKYAIKLRIEGRQIFLTIKSSTQEENKFKVLLLTDSLYADVLTLKIHNKAGSSKKIDCKNEPKSKQSIGQYSEQIEECRKMQKKLIQILNQYNK